MRELAKHLEITLRSFARQPGMVLIVVLTLALGIGASTSLFTYLVTILRPTMDAPQPRAGGVGLHRDRRGAVQRRLQP